jgi:DNA-binding MarR family transcriptional regulator
MFDNDVAPPPRDNIRSLLYLLSLELDERIARRRQGTKYAHVRASDVRVFIFASNGGATLSDVARTLGISRQAVHMSARRLKETGVVTLKPAANGKRETTISLTADGEAAMVDSREHIRMLEDEVMEVIGPEGLENFRRTLQTVLMHTRAKNAASAASATPQA